MQKKISQLAFLTPVYKSQAVSDMRIDYSLSETAIFMIQSHQVSIYRIDINHLFLGLCKRHFHQSYPANYNMINRRKILTTNIKLKPTIKGLSKTLFEKKIP